MAWSPPNAVAAWTASGHPAAAATTRSFESTAKYGYGAVKLGLESTAATGSAASVFRVAARQFPSTAPARHRRQQFAYFASSAAAILTSENAVDFFFFFVFIVRVHLEFVRLVWCPHVFCFVKRFSILSVRRFNGVA